MESTKTAPALPTGRVRTPFVLQMEVAECGAAALAIILGYWGRIVPLADLRRDCGVSRDGANAAYILRAARAYGLTARGLRKDVADLKDLKYPYVVFWNFNHFIVVEGYANGMVYVNDPASGPRKITFDEFDESYTGIVLDMQPGPDFRAEGTTPSTPARLWSRLKGSVGAVALCALAALLMVIPGLAVPALMQVFIDEVLIEGLRDWARPVILGILAAVLLRAVLTSIQTGLLRRLRQRLAAGMSSRFVSHLLELPAAYYGQRFSGEISVRVAANDRVADALSGRLATTVIDLFMMVFYAAVMLQFDRVLTAIGVTFALTHFLALRWMLRRRRDETHRLSNYTGKVASVAISGLRSIRTIKASGLESDFFARWAGHFANLSNTRQELGLSNQYLGVLPPLLTGLMTLLILAAGGLRVMNGALTIGQLIGFHSMMASFLWPVNNLVSLSVLMQDLEADLNRLDDVLTYPVHAEPAADLETFPAKPRLDGTLEFRNVSFGYNPLAPPLVNGLSFRLEPGRRIALIGASGSGKSTIAKLAAGIYSPASGEILLDGLQRSSIPREILANSVAMVDQDILLFEGTVRDNLTLWDSTVPDSALAAAARDAAIHEVIVSWPDMYEEHLLEGAANVSGGEKQRLEIARALVNNPSILILDEATSALDPETERLIVQNLRRRGCSCLIVAHRLSTIRDCDEILVMRDGNVVQRGSHEQLVREGGEYTRLLMAGEGALLEAA